MFIPNSPSPPSGITVSDCLLLLNEGFSPQPNSESYHTAPHGTGTPTCPAAISQSHLQRQFNELILVRVAAFGEGLEDLREKKEL
jgi:hypothetical protein